MDSAQLFFGGTEDTQERCEACDDQATGSGVPTISSSIQTTGTSYEEAGATVLLEYDLEQHSNDRHKRWRSHHLEQHSNDWHKL